MAMSMPVTMAEYTRRLSSLISEYCLGFAEVTFVLKCFEKECKDTRLMSSGGACSGVWGAVRAKYRNSGLSLKWKA